MDLKQLSNEMDKNLAKAMIVHNFIILLSAIIITFIIDSIVAFDQGTFQTLATTVIQTFSAMAALIFVIGTYYLNKINEDYKKFENDLDQKIQRISFPSNSEEIKKFLDDKDKEIRRETEFRLGMIHSRVLKLRARLLRIVAFTLVLIFVSLLSLIFTKAQLKIPFPTYSWTTNFLTVIICVYSIYILYCILHEIYNVFKLDYEID
jgi:hypothetical protein